MNKTLLVFIIFLLSCNNQQLAEKNKIIDSLQIQNKGLQVQVSILQEDYNNRIKNIPIPDYSKTYAYCVLYWDKENFDGTIEPRINACSVNEFNQWNEDTKYKFLNDFSKSFYNSYNPGFKKITKLVCLTFNSYSEASKDRNKKLNIEEDNP